jgi:hypothetical protein
MAAANRRRLESFRKNARFIAGVRWLSTLDSHTCIRCAVLDGQSWDLDGKRHAGTMFDFISPPLHENCRCVLSPIAKGFESARWGTRASCNGQVDAAITFDEFLRRQPLRHVEEMLGERRAQLFLSGRLALRDFIGDGLRELPIDEVERLAAK